MTKSEFAKLIVQSIEECPENCISDAQYKARTKGPTSSASSVAGSVSMSQDRDADRAHRKPTYTATATRGNAAGTTVEFTGPDAEKLYKCVTEFTDVAQEDSDSFRCAAMAPLLPQMPKAGGE